MTPSTNPTTAAISAAALGQQQGVHERLPHQGQHRSLLRDRGPEVQLNRLPQPLDVLHRKGLVQTEGAPEGGALSVTGVLAQEADRRVTGYQVDKHEHDDRDADQDWY